MGLYWGYIGVILGLYWGYIGVILGLYWSYIGVIWGIMEKKMETTTMGYMGGCHNYGLFLGETTIVYWGNIGTMENKMEAIILGGCQSLVPVWGTLNIRCHTITGPQKGTIILTTTHFEMAERQERCTNE